MEDASLEDFLGGTETEGSDADSETGGVGETGDDEVGDGVTGDDEAGDEGTGGEEGRRTAVDGDARSGPTEDEPANSEDAIATDADAFANGEEPSANGDEPSANGDEPAANGDEPSANGEDPSATGSSGTGEVDAASVADQGVASGIYSFAPAGASCVACGDEVEGRWREGRGLVCASCKSW